MGEKGKKDKGQKEEQKKPALSLKEKRLGQCECIHARPGRNEMIIIFILVP